MKKRSFDEMIAYFNRRVADMNISQECKMELVGMVTALGYKHEKSAHQWIPCSERLPEEGGYYLTTTMYQEVYCDYWNGDNFDRTEMVIAWMPLPEPWKGEQNEQTETVPVLWKKSRIIDNVTPS